MIITPDVFKQCERNTCGNFGKNHACPPKAGSEEERIARVKKYDDGYLVNIVLSIKNREDMMNSGVLFNEATSKLSKLFENDDVFVMGAGPCTICKKCSALDEEPCRFQEKIQYSMEGSGIDVMRMSMNFKMTYPGFRVTRPVSVETPAFLSFFLLLHSLINRCFSAFD